MFTRLLLHRKPYQPLPEAVHPGCTTSGRLLGVFTADRRKLLEVARVRMDPACFTAFEDRSREAKRRQAALEYGLTCIAVTGSKLLGVHLEGGRVTVRPGSYLIVNPNTALSSVDTSFGFSGYWIFLGQLMLRHCRDVAGIPKTAGPFDFESAGRRLTPAMKNALSLFDERWERPAQEEWDVWEPSLAYAAGIQLLSALWATHPNGLKARLKQLGYRDAVDPRVHQAAAYLRQHLAEPVNLDRLARTIGMSRATLFRKFMEGLHRTPRDYLRGLRVEEAESLLQRSPGRPLLDIAHQVGFEKARSLSAAFDAVKGPGALALLMNRP